MKTKRTGLNGMLAAVDREETQQLWNNFPIWIENTSRVTLMRGDLRGLTGTVVERRDPLVWEGVILAYGEYKVRWDDPKYGVSGWARPNTDIELLTLG